MVFFCVLGRVAVSVDGNEQVLGSTREAALLGDLLVHANEVVSADRLIDDLWHGVPPAGAGATLHTYVRNLRRRLEPGRASRAESEVLVTRRPGYQLLVDRDGLDSWRAEAWIRDGRDALAVGDVRRARQLFTDALTLWEGPPFGELADEPFVRAEAARLEDLRLVALEERASAALALGDHFALCGELSTSIADHPYRERLWELWMLALYRSGRQTDALRAHDRLRHLLREELGIDPSESVTSLHSAILEHDPQLESWALGGPAVMRPTVTSPRVETEELAPPILVPEIAGTFDEASLASGTPMVGRAAELEVLSAALKSARTSGRRQIVMIGGEPGIGKTTLVSAFAKAAKTDGNTVVFGRCHEDLEVPFRLWATLLSQVIHRAGGPVAEVVAANAADLSPLALFTSPLGDAGQGGTDPEMSRYLLFAAVRRVLEAAAAHRPLVLVLDDLHWCDASSLQLLRHIVSICITTPLIVAATYRTSDVGVRGPFEEFLAWLHLEPAVTRVALGGLEVADLTVLLEAGDPSAVDEALARLCTALARETDGNPFFVGELVRHLRETGSVVRDGAGRWHVGGDLWDGGLPATVRDVIVWRAGRLGDDTVGVLSVAAVIGQTFDLEILAAAIGRSQGEVLDVLEAAIAAELVLNDERDRFRFKHALVGHALHDTVAPARRIWTHRRVGEAIERLVDPSDGSRLTDLAVHFGAACDGRADPGTLEKAMQYTRAAGNAALERLAPEDALAWYRQALQFLERLPDRSVSERCALMVCVGDAQRQSGDPAATATLIAAAELARELGDTDNLIAAVLANNRGIFSTTGLVDETRIALIEAALTATGDVASAPRARLLSQLAVESLTRIGHVERKALVAEAVAIARRLDDPAILLDVLVRSLEAIRLPDNLDDRLAVTADAERLARDLGDRVGLFWSMFQRAFAAAESADAVEADRCHRGATELASEIGQPTLRWMNGLIVASFVLLRGDTAAAEALADHALQWGLSSGQPDAVTLYQFQLHIIRWHQGRGSEVIELLENLADTIPLPLFRAATARVYVDIGRLEDAQALLASELSAGFAHLQDLSYLAGLSNWVEVAVRLDDHTAIDALHQRLVPYAAQMICTRTHVAGAVAHYLGLLEAARDDHDAARAHFDTALSIHRDFHAPFHVARTHLALAHSLRAERRLGSPDDAIAHALTARDIAADAGCEHVRVGAEDLLAE
jgi:DNA-binding SARP family transcriptional activator/tetratricopeptide (TPR) repeat protein